MSAARFAHLGHLVGQGLTPDKMPLALKECGLTVDDLKGYLAWQTQPGRIGSVPTVMLENWAKTTEEGIRFESDRGEFGYAWELDAMHRRVMAELVKRG